MMSLTFGLFTQVSGSGPLGPLVVIVTNRITAFIHYLFIQFSLFLYLDC